MFNDFLHVRSVDAALQIVLHKLDMLPELPELPLERVLERQEPVVELLVGRPFRSIYDLTHRLRSDEMPDFRRNIHQSAGFLVRGRL